MLNEKAAATLHDARERRGWSRSQLREATKALGMEVSEATIYDLENGGHNSPRKRTVYKLAEALDLNPDDLFEAPATDGVAS